MSACFIKRPMTVKAANRVVGDWHRHSKPVTGGLWALGAESDGELVGVAIAGRPVARLLNNGWTIEVVRLATDGCRNACSFLYAACWRAARSLGYRRQYTYTLASEDGASVKAAGGRFDGVVKARMWNTPSRPRYDADLFGEPVTPAQDKHRWIWEAA